MDYYFLQNLNDGTYWNGQYRSEDWNKTPRLFKTPSALLSSLHSIPLSWLNEFKQANPEPPKEYSYDDLWYKWSNLKRQEWEKFAENRNSIEILKMFAAQGWITFKIENVEESLLTLATNINYMKKLLFLGGTCAGSLWREKLIPLLDTNKINYHNPVITGRPWTSEDNVIEREMRAKADYKLYVITPKMQGVLAIAEVTFDACKSPEKTLFCYLPEDDGVKFADHQIKSLNATISLINQAGAKVFNNLQEIADYLNQ